jgi:hypothetical protein
VLDSTLARRAYGQRIDAGGGPPPAYAATVWVNEFHYDNEGTDTGEFLELAVPATVDPSTVTVTLYNGNGGAAYDTRAASDGVAGASTGEFTLYTLHYGVATTGIQNGSPDGIAVTVEGEVVLFASYEGTFTAIDGPAAGLVSLDVGVAETGSTPVGQSLSLRGSGSAYADFTWFNPGPATPGGVNVGQSFVPVASEPNAPAAPAALRIVGPNPLTTFTRLEVTLAGSETVTLEAFDALGRRVDVLADGHLPAGTSVMTWDAARLPNGVYLLRLTAGGTTELRVVTVAR